MPNKKKIVIGICGSIAAVECIKLIRRIKKEGIDVYAAMTESAQRIVHPDAVEWASDHPAITNLTGRAEHVALLGTGGFCDLLLVCPATANTISKIANGIDDTTVTTMATTAIGSNIPVVIVPAMHISLYNNPFVKENIEKLKSAGVHFIAPVICENKAKAASNEDIAGFVIKILSEI